MKSEIELNVTDLARGGAGVARDSEGRVIFIPFSAPGDRVRVQITNEDKRYAQGEIIEILEPSDRRQTPPCPVFSQCGGCQWQHLPYELQWETKVKGVLHALSRVNVPNPELIDRIPAEQIWEYRNRIQLRGEGRKIGFFRRGSKDLVPVEKCWIAREEINQSWDRIRSEAARFNRPYKVEVEIMPSGNVELSWNSRHAAGGFRQVHDQQNEKLRHWIAQNIAGKDLLFDLFGGAGNLSLLLADQFSEIHCVDLSSPRSSPPGTPAHFSFHRAPVLNWILEKTSQTKNQNSEARSVKSRSAGAILDPPREGLGSEFSEIAQSLEVLGVQELIAVGCDPDSWARDVARWKKKGWTLKKVMIIDLFPQTPHVESVALLERR